MEGSTNGGYAMHVDAWGAETDGEEATRALGRALGAALRGGEVLALHGPLGAGKTVLAQGILEGLGVPGPHPSPTFTLLRAYRGRLPVNHIDLYRLGDRAPQEDLGWAELLEGGDPGATGVGGEAPRGGVAASGEAAGGGAADARAGEHAAVALVEWAEFLGDLLPADRLDVFLERAPQGPSERRRIRLLAGGPGAARLLDAVAAAGGGVARPRS
jgi:tRNA threonylcarbamoyladenosine biosynthesis protein TsaE